MTVSGAGVVRIGDRDVPRMGYGTMRLTGPAIWGPPADPAAAVAVLRRAVELGVRVIDSAWYYGPDSAHRLVREALAPYPDDLVLVTKLGGGRRDDKSWYAATSPAELRAGCERDLSLLGLDSVPITHLRWMDGPTPFDAALTTLIDLRDEGKIQRIGLSNINLEQLSLALAEIDVATVSNLYSVGERRDDPVLNRCTELGIPYLPYFPLAIGKVGGELPVAAVAGRLGVPATTVALAWLLQRSPVMLPIPGTSKVPHLEDNLAAADLVLSADDLAELEGDVS